MKATKQTSFFFQTEENQPALFYQLYKLPCCLNPVPGHILQMFGQKGSFVCPYCFSEWEFNSLDKTIFHIPLRQKGK